MKKKTLLSLLACFALALPTAAQKTASAQPQAATPSPRPFTVRVAIPGLTANCDAKLEAVNGYDRDDLATAKTTAGALTFAGTIATPTLVQLSINDRPSYGDHEYPEDRGARFYIEPGVTTTVTAAAFDSLPRNYEMGATPLRLEPMVHVTGGPVQQHYQEYRSYIYAADLAAWHCDHVQWLAMFSDRSPLRAPSSTGAATNSSSSSTGAASHRSPAFHAGQPAAQANEAQQAAALSALMAQSASAAQAVVDAMNHRFIAVHPSYAISAALQQKQLEEMFRFTSKDLDSIAALFATNEDPAALQALRDQLQAYRPFVRGAAVTDFEVQLPDGTKKRFADYLPRDRYTFVDLWASWCGPCRAAIPKVKALHERLGAKLNILSVSVDQKEPDWQRAMADEAMPWTQLLATRAGTRTLQQSYNLQAIPYLLLLSPDGRVVMSSHDPDAIATYLNALGL